MDSGFGSDTSVEGAPIPLRRNRGFGLLMAGQFASSLGSGIAAIAIPLILLEVTGSAATAGTIAGATSLLSVGVGLLAGVYADRWPRRLTLIVSALVASVSWGVCAVVLSIDGPAAIAVATAAGLSTLAMTFFQPAQNGAVRNLVSRDQLPQAIAIDDARDTIAGLIGSPIGGVLITLGSALTVLANSVGYLIAAICITVITAPLGPHRVATTDVGAESSRSYVRGVLSDALAGLRHIWSTPAIRLTFITACALNLPFLGIQFAIVIGLGSIGTQPYLIALTEVAAGLGGVAGAALVGPLNKRFTLGMQVVLTAALAAVTGLLIACAFPNVWWLLPACFANVLFIPALNGALMGYLFGSAPEEMTGRLGSAAQVAAGIFVPFSPFLAGVLVEVWSGRAALFVFVGVLALIAVILAASPSIRRLKL
jgi:MFS family permease